MPKVMLVEDDNNLREIYQARLQAEGYEIVSAKDGEEGLVIAKAEKPDLIIADVMMPKISGFEMLDILRNTEGLKAVKVIMLTALGQSEDEQRAHSLGADRYLVKSQVTLEDIVKASHELLSDATDQPAAPVAPPADAPSDAPSTDAPAPAATPAQPTVSIPVTEPPADDAATNDAAATAAKDAQSTAQEEANAESRIENFVAGATEEPTPPSGATPTDNAVVDDTKAADDDKLVADAAQAMIDSTKDKAPATPAAPVVPAAPAAPAAPVVPVVPAEPASQPEPEEESSGSTPIAHKKVIKPLNDKPKQDINSLLAAEEAKEANEPDDQPSGQVAGAPSIPPAPDSPANPGNIAL